MIPRPDTARRRIGWFLAVAFACSPAVAVTDEEIFRDFRFNFINPGGRSLGLGGAFISIADDATAAQTNPAGLTNLFEPQVFSEIRLIKPESQSTAIEFRDPFLPGEGFDLAVQTNPSAQFSPSFIGLHPPRRKGLARTVAPGSDQLREPDHQHLRVHHRAG